MTSTGTAPGNKQSGHQISFITKLYNFAKEYRDMEKVTINLDKEGAKNNDPFFHKMAQSYYKEANRRSLRMPLIKNMEIGVALIELPSDFNDYFMKIESSARRNYKKSIRNEYTFSRFEYNNKLDDIWEIHKSTKYRQGAMPLELTENRPKAINNGTSETNLHDYIYYGVFDSNDKLVSYLGIMLAGDLAMIGNIFGHAEHQSNGVVPRALIDGAQHIIQNFPKVKYYGYGTYFGASDTLRRFKRKFCFTPRRVKWIYK